MLVLLLLLFKLEVFNVSRGGLRPNNGISWFSAY